MLLVSCVITALTGCANISVPTGTSEERYLNTSSVSPVATVIYSAKYDPIGQTIYLEVSQYKLQQLYTVPKHFNTASRTIELSYPNAKPKNNYKWESQKISWFSLYQMRQVSLTSQGGDSISVPVDLKNERVELELSGVIDKLHPNVLYKVACASCTPWVYKKFIPSEYLPAPPSNSNEVSFSILPPEKVSILNKLEDLRKAQLAEKRARETEAHELEQRMAKEKRELELKLAREKREREQQLAAEKRERDARIRTADAERKREAARVVREGDGSTDDLVCKKYGFRPNTQAYANCRLQIDVAKREMQQQQAQYMAQQQQFEAAQETARERRQNEFLLGMGLRMMGGQNPAGAYVDQSVGAPMYQPPPPSTRTYSFPNGRMMTCTSNGSFTNCY
jgi:Tfp pilus assembly protein PilV